MSRAPWNRWPWTMRPGLEPERAHGDEWLRHAARRARGPAARTAPSSRHRPAGSSSPWGSAARRAPRRARPAAPARAAPPAWWRRRTASRPCRRPRRLSAATSVPARPAASSFFAARAWPSPTASRPTAAGTSFNSDRARLAGRLHPGDRDREPARRREGLRAALRREHRALREPVLDALRESLAEAAAAPSAAAPRRRARPAASRLTPPAFCEHREAEALARVVVALRHGLRGCGCGRCRRRARSPRSRRAHRAG